jgi:hypothetical protein
MGRRARIPLIHTVVFERPLSQAVTGVSTRSVTLDPFPADPVALATS